MPQEGGESSAKRRTDREKECLERGEREQGGEHNFVKREGKKERLERRERV